MKKVKERKNRRSFSEFLENQTDMPPISLSDIPYIEISGRKHIELDGVHKILEYNSDKIRIRFRHSTVAFSGNELFISNFRGRTAIIKGVVASVVFEG